jgi:hypothetical protein
MSKRGDYWGNAVLERFFVTRQTELVDAAHWLTSEAVRAAVVEYIEYIPVWYTRQRRPSSLGHSSSAHHEAEQRQHVARAACPANGGKSTPPPAS